MRNQEAATVARIFLDEIISRYGIPKVLVTDNGTNFTSDLFKRVCKLLLIKKLEITAYHTKANGSLERTHRPLGDFLRIYVEDHKSNWDIGLKQFTFIYNNSRQTSTKFTPHELLFGYTTEISNNLKKDPAPRYSNDHYALYLQHKLRRLHKKAKFFY
jgi:transposase InsO family protein